MHRNQHLKQNLLESLYVEGLEDAGSLGCTANNVKKHVLEDLEDLGGPEGLRGLLTRPSKASGGTGGPGRAREACGR